MGSSKNMYLINEDPRAPGIMIRILDHDLPGVELSLGTGATHNIVVQLGLSMVTAKKVILGQESLIILGYRRPQASLRRGSPTRSGSLHLACFSILTITNSVTNFDNISVEPSSTCLTLCQAWVSVEQV